MARTKRAWPPNYLSKPWLIEIYRSGELVIRQRDEPQLEGVLPVMSVDTKEEAEHIQVGLCVLSRTDNKTYRLNPRYRFEKDLLDLHDLEPLRQLIEADLYWWSARQAERLELKT